jgi:hypothetical protein
MSDKVVKQGPGVGQVADFLGFIGGAFALAANEVGAPKVERFEKVATDLRAHLTDIFRAIQRLLQDTLVTIFQEGQDDKANDRERLRNMMGMLNNMGASMTRMRRCRLLLCEYRRMIES